MGPPKILYPSVRSEAVPNDLNTAYKLVHQNLFRLYTDLCKKNISLIATGSVVT